MAKILQNHRQFRQKLHPNETSWESMQDVAFTKKIFIKRLLICYTLKYKL